MTWSSNRIIKLKQPIKKVTVLPQTHDVQAGDFEQGLNRSGDQPLEDILQMSKTEFQQELDFAYRKGLEEGKLSGYQQAEQDFQQKVENLAGVIKTFEGQQKRLFAQVEDSLLGFSLKIAEKILYELPPFIPGMIKKSINQIVDMLRNEPFIEVYLNPADLESFKEMQTEFEKSLPNLNKLLIKTDPRITRGGCTIATENGKIDARIETQVEKLIHELRKTVATFSSEEKSA